MSNESAPEILKHADNRNVQVRLDYMLIFRSESRAKIIRVLETWTNTKYAEGFKGTADNKEQKIEPPVEDLWVTMSYDQFSLFVYGTIQHDTIKQQIDELIASKHIQRRVHPVYPYGPPQYLLNRELVQKELDELEIPPNLFDLLPLFVTPRKKRTPQEKYPQGGGKKQGRDPGKIPPGTGETSYPSNNNTNNTENQAKNEDTNPRDPEPALPADVPAPPSGETSSHSQTPAQGYRNPDARSSQAELSTSRGTSPQASAKVVSAPPPAPTPTKEQLTLLGGQVRADYETIRACRLRMTQANIRYLNTLGELDGMNFLNLKETLDLIEEQDLVKKKSIPIGLQELASEEGYWRFDKWCPVVIRNRQKRPQQQQSSKPAPTPTQPVLTSSSLPSFSHMSNEEYSAYLNTKGARR